MARRNSRGQSFDETKAFEKALDYDLSEKVYGDAKMYKYLKLKGNQFGVSPSMFLPAMLVCISNLMGMSQVLEIRMI